MIEIAQGRDEKDSLFHLVRTEVIGCGQELTSTFVHSQQYIVKQLIPLLVKQCRELMFTGSETEAQQLANATQEPVYWSLREPEDDRFGMMNTADRSLTLVDYALRRRFSFFSMEPGYDTNGFRKYQQSINNEKLNAIIDIVRELNIAISADSTLGKGFCIGHSYFCELTECTDDQLKTIVEYDIIPTLSEYWFDNEAELEKWNNRLLGVF